VTARLDLVSTIIPVLNRAAMWREAVASAFTQTCRPIDYLDYPQLYPPHDPAVSILDLLFMTGPEAENYIAGGAT